MDALFLDSGRKAATFPFLNSDVPPDIYGCLLHPNRLLFRHAVVWGRLGLRHPVGIGGVCKKVPAILAGRVRLFLDLPLAKVWASRRIVNGKTCFTIQVDGGECWCTALSQSCTRPDYRWGW